MTTVSELRWFWIFKKEKENQNDGFYSDLNQKNREESERNEKEIEELEELMSREVNPSIMRYDPPEDDEEDSFQISEKDMQAEKQRRVANAQKTKVFSLFLFWS